MNSSTPADDRFLQRALRFQDGSLSAAEITALEAEMLASEEKRRAFAEMQMQSMLLNEVLRREAYASPASATVVPFTAQKPKSILRRFRWAFAAAAVILAGLILIQFLRRESEPWKGPHRSHALAQITYDNGGEWEDDRQPRNNLLPVGTYSLTSGTVRLKFDHDDTVATLAGPARFDILPPGHIRLHEGRLSARVSQPDKGFTVHTDALTVLDRGTVFGVDVRADGEALVSVLEGKVDVAEPGSKVMQRIEQGGRLSARPKGKRIVQPADDEPSGFEDLWPLTLGVDRLDHLVEFVVPRAKHKWQEYRSDTRLFLMPERQRVQPSGPLTVDILPGVPVDYKKKEPQVHLLSYAGRVNSYLIFFRPLEDAKERRPVIHGSITFSQPVIGIVTDSALLQATDDTLGHPRVIYRDKPRRGIESWKKPAERDVVHISKDGRRLSFTLHATADPDEFRVLVAAP